MGAHKYTNIISQSLISRRNLHGARTSIPALVSRDVILTSFTSMDGKLNALVLDTTRHSTVHTTDMLARSPRICRIES